MKVRRDFLSCNIWMHLQLIAQLGQEGKMMKPHALYVLTPEEFKLFVHTIESLKMPTGYSSSLGKHIQERKFRNLKSHDYHMLMQQIMPFVLQGLLTEGTQMVFMCMCKILCRLCTKVYNPATFDSWPFAYYGAQLLGSALCIKKY